jgi:hypothetical protein
MKEINKTGLFLAICFITLFLLIPTVAAYGSPAKMAGWSSLSYYKTAPLATWNPAVATMYLGVHNTTSNSVSRIGTSASPDHFDNVLAQLTYYYPSGCGA